jgi:hypothetical protein
MNGRNGPLSPVSVGGSEWSGISKYQNDPYSSNPTSNNNRGQLASPPISSGSSGTMNGFPPRGSSGGSPGGPSPPSSIARSSVGTGLYAQSESERSRKNSLKLYYQNIMLLSRDTWLRHYEMKRATQGRTERETSYYAYHLCSFKN